MSIDVQREGNSRVAQVVLDCFNVVSAADRGNSVGVPQIVKANVRAARNVMDGSPQMFERSRNRKLV